MWPKGYIFVTSLYPRSTEGGIGVYWIHPDVCPSVRPCIDKVSGTFWKNYWLNSFHTWHLPLWGDSLDPYHFPVPSLIFSCDQAALQMVFSVRLSVCPSVCLSVCPSVRLSVRLSHLFDYVPIIVSSLNFQELLPMTKVRSMQKVKVRGQRSRSQRSQPNLTVSGL